MLCIGAFFMPLFISYMAYGAFFLQSWDVASSGQQAIITGAPSSSMKAWFVSGLYMPCECAWIFTYRFKLKSAYFPVFD